MRPRVIAPPGERTTLLPDELADRLSGRTDAEGRASFPGLSATTRLFDVRIAHPTLADQDLVIDFEIGSKQESTAIRLNPLGRIVGKIAREGNKASPPSIEVWKTPDGLGGRLSPVHFDKGSIEENRDGTFSTPIALTRGAKYRAVVREEGFAPTISPWVALDDATADFGTIALVKMKAITGRAVDRQGKPLAGVAVFQSGDGPEPTSTTADDQGRFHLGGFSREHSFVFATKDGFRFQGRAVDLSKNEDVSIVLTRTSEAVERVLTTLPDLWTRDEMRTAARRILMPTFERMVNKEGGGGSYWVFKSLVSIDPVDALDRLDGATFKLEQARERIRGLAAVALAKNDPDEAAATAESTRNPAMRGENLLSVAAALPTKERARKIDLIERAIVIERKVEDRTKKLVQLARAVDMLDDLGERDKATTVMDEAEALADKVVEQERRRFRLRRLGARPLQTDEGPAHGRVARPGETSR